MRKLAMGVFLVAVLAGVLITSTYATTVSIEANISQDFSVVFQFTIGNETIYTNLKTNTNLINETTVPETIRTSFLSKGNLAPNALEYSNATIDFNDTALSIRSAFDLSGQGIISSTIGRTTSIETFTANTEWRKFYLNITNNFSINFTQDLAAPLTTWTNSTVNGIPSFSFSNSTAGVSCTFDLPSSATSVTTIGETISFNVPYQTPWVDKLIDSPILILIALAIAGVVIYVYRKTR